MNTVGRIGSYIGRGVSTVSGTFHPFGGAVDIIVVEQPDGSLKSSPWYVRFGKFQGVLKAKEKVVNISVNGVEAGFHMYLDSRGQAYFIKELDIESGDSLSSSSSSGEDTDGQTSSRRLIKSKSCKYDAPESESKSTAQINASGEDELVSANSRRAGILGMVFGRRSMKDDRLLEDDADASFVRTDSLERAEIAADLLEMRWSTNLTAKQYLRDYAARDMSEGGKGENLQVNDRKGDMSSIANDNMLEKDCVQTTQNCVQGTDQHVLFSASEDSTQVPTLVQSTYSSGEGLRSSGDGDEPCVVNADHDAGCSTITSMVESSSSQVVDSSNLEKQNSFTANHLSMKPNETGVLQSFSHYEAKENSTVVLDVSTEQVAENLCVTHAENMEACLDAQTQLSMNDVISLSNYVAEADFDRDVSMSCSRTSTSEDQDQKSNIVDKATSKVDDYSKALSNPHESSGNSVPLTVPSSGSPEEEQLLFGDMDDCCDTAARFTESISSDYQETVVYNPTSSGCPDELKDSIPSNYESVPIPEKSIEDDPPLVGVKLRTVSSNVDIPAGGMVQDNKIRRSAKSLPNLSSHDDDFPSNPDDINSSIVLQTTEVAEVVEESKSISATPEIGKDLTSFDSSSRSWRSWSFSFKRSRSIKSSGVSMDEDVSIDAKSISNNTGGDRERDVRKPKISKRKIMLTTPTSEQLATLNLKEGKNIVVFTFFTAMLGRQQVEGRIFLWRWDSKIVISDVDGTITRSDVLGQFMPLVGMDWSQIGVTRLFSAIKENGYQLLFLSARAISQAYHTRQFLFNLMQDGKGLPDGPVLTSPDGIFPSLFREVVRRAPHEFKIACLQDVKALFPSDRNPYPFYAGFGNRITDEISYLKVGIPKGKIFTINPKGQIVVNCHIDTKSYTSLHGLVNGMFPAKSSCEQEDFNYWNYWKLPPPPFD